MTDNQKEIIKLYEQAIAVCEQWRTKYTLAKATPNQIHLYNIFNQAKNSLKGHLACIEDTLEIYMKDRK